MKTSVSIWSVHAKVRDKEMDNESFIRFCNENGVKYVELLDVFLNNEEEIQIVQNTLKELDMEVSSYSIGNDFVQRTEEEREAQLDSVLRGIDMAVRLNAKFMRVFSGNGKEGIPFDTAKQWIIDGFKKAADYAKEKGIIMVIENHGLFVGKSAQVKELIELVGSEYLRANTDVGNFLLANEYPLDSVRNLKDYVAFVHFKDFKEVSKEEQGYGALDGRKYMGTVLGQGEVPMKEIVDFLHENGYSGFLSIEYEGPGDQIQGTIQSIKYTNSIIK
jgi:sugar phosphate isomerase/epimerase